MDDCKILKVVKSILRNVGAIFAEVQTFYEKSSLSSGSPLLTMYYIVCGTDTFSSHPSFVYILVVSVLKKHKTQEITIKMTLDFCLANYC